MGPAQVRRGLQSGCPKSPWVLEASPVRLLHGHYAFRFALPGPGSVSEQIAPSATFCLTTYTSATWGLVEWATPGDSSPGVSELSLGNIGLPESGLSSVVKPSSESAPRSSHPTIEHHLFESDKARQVGKPSIGDSCIE